MQDMERSWILVQREATEWVSVEDGYSDLYFYFYLFLGFILFICEREQEKEQRGRERDNQTPH